MISSLEYKFNHSIDKVKFPDNLKELYLGSKFKHSIDEVKFPHNLKILHLSSGFNLNIDYLPESLEELKLGPYFSKPIINLPDNIKKLVIFSTGCKICKLPKNLKKLVCNKSLIKSAECEIPDNIIKN